MDYISGWCKSNRRLEGLTAIVTGSNNGIGKETALDLYSRGARVIMACRDTLKGETAKSEMELSESSGVLVVEKLDLSCLNSVRQFALLMLAREPNIHILVNNAGVMMCPKGRTEDGFETHIGTNHFGHALLTIMLLPSLVESGARVVFVSSFIHTLYTPDLDDINFENTPYDSKKAYSWSKAANILFARALATKLREHNIHNVTTYSLHPGVIDTGIGRHFSHTVFPGATWLFNNVLSWFVKSPRCGAVLIRLNLKLITSAQTTIYCAVDEVCAQESGLYYSDCAVCSASKCCQSDEVAEKLWKITIEALGENDPFSAEGKLETLPPGNSQSAVPPVPGLE